jgi:NAD+ synthase
MNHQQVASFIVAWLRDYAQSVGAKGFVVGVSGGIDSALTSTLCAMTGLRTVVVEMPIYQPQTQVSRAMEHIAWLKTKYSQVHDERVELTEVFDAFCKSVSADHQDQMSGLALANVRSRLRMVSLYYFASQQGLLVAGTGNKVEDFGIGFYTKYGDGGVDLSPIADLMKTEVFALSKHLGIVSSILQARPTDGLWGDDRTDEDQIGASYSELERCMQWLAERGLQAIDVKLNQDLIKDLSDREKYVMQIYIQRHLANQHKMIPIPVCVIPGEVRG